MAARHDRDEDRRGPNENRCDDPIDGLKGRSYVSSWSVKGRRLLIAASFTFHQQGATSPYQTGAAATTTTTAMIIMTAVIIRRAENKL